MDNNNNSLLDLDGQTAPESTRGLFDFPENPSSSMRRSSSDWMEKQKRLSSNCGDLGSRFSSTTSKSSNNINKQQQQQQRGLHTVNEEDFHHQKQQQQQQRKSMHRESFNFQQQNDYNNHQSQQQNQRDSIDTTSSSNSSPLFQRKQRSSVAHFNSFPLPKRFDDIDENQRSRADVLAETEAKLSGHIRYSNNGGGLVRSDEKQNRRLSEPNTRIHQYMSQQQQKDYYNNLDSSTNQNRQLLMNNNNKRMSFQYNNNYNNTTNVDERRLSLSSSISNSRLMDFDSNKRSSRSSNGNNGSVMNDWRSPSTTNASRPHSTVGVINNHRFSTGSSFFDSNNAVNNSNSNGGGHQRKPLFTSHLPFSSVVPHLKSNVLVSGLLRVNKRNRSDAYVFCEDFNADIYICGSRDRNRALEGDHVAIKLIEVDQVMLEKHEKEEAKLARNNGNPVVRKPDEEDEKEIIFGGEEDVDLVTPRFCGVVVAILDRAQKQVFSGTLGLTRPSNKRLRNNSVVGGMDEQQIQNQRDSTSTTIPRIIWFKPTDKRVPLIAIPVEQAPPGFVENPDEFENRLFLGSIKRWPITSLHPFGVLENELGVVQDTRVQLRAILADNNITTQIYPEALIRSIPTNLLNPDIIEREIESKSRRDLRTSAHCITLIDDEGGFMENALSISRINDDSFEVGLHVADVTTFVGADSALDKEARSRGVDVYHTLSESVPLWPKYLLEECTNFVQGKDRFAFSIIWTIKSTGEVCGTWYGKTVINSSAVLSQQELQDMIDYSSDNYSSEDLCSEKEDSRVLSDVSSLYSISKLLHEERSQRAMFLKSPNLDIRFSNDATPVYISTKTQLPCEIILQEFQILANTQVAQKISSHFPDHALLRSQSLPNERKLRGLTRYLDTLGYTIQPESPSNLQKSIDAIVNPEAKAVIETLVMKSMSQEKYFCTGAFDINRYHHYSLNAPLYTHFTSPTKRYADTIVHRQLEAYLNGSQFFFMEPEIVQKTAQHCNVKGRAAENAKEQTQHMFSSYYLANNSGVSTNRVQDAIVVGIQEGAFDVIVPELGLERRIHAINLPLKSSTFSPSENVLHLVWIQGEATVDAGVETAISVDDDEEEEELFDHSDDEEDVILVDIDTSDVSEQVKRLSIKSSSGLNNSNNEDKIKKDRRKSTSIRAIQGEDAWVTQKECTFPNECRQLIRPFDFVKVVITADPIRSPPLIRVLAANPFVTKQ